MEAVVDLGRSGAFQSVATYEQVAKDERSTRRLLALPVEAALRNTQFARECEYRRIYFVFEFALTSDAKDTQRPEFEYGFPNHFWITARSPLQVP